MNPRQQKVSILGQVHNLVRTSGLDESSPSLRLNLEQALRPFMLDKLTVNKYIEAELEILHIERKTGRVAEFSTGVLRWLPRETQPSNALSQSQPQPSTIQT